VLAVRHTLLLVVKLDRIAGMRILYVLDAVSDADVCPASPISVTAQAGR
jgi:hypothetical protein